MVVSKMMWEPKALFFCLFLFYYFSFTFRPKFITNELGLSVTQLAYSTTCNYIVGAIGASVWTFLANKTGGHRNYIICNSILASLVFFSLKLIPLEQANEYFPLILSILAAFQFLLSGLIPLMDAQVLDYLDGALVIDVDSDADIEKQKKRAYGRQRMFGTLGFGFVTLSVGVLYDQVGANGLFYVCAVSAGLLIFAQISVIPGFKAVSPKPINDDIKSCDLEMDSNLKDSNGDEQKKDKSIWEKYNLLIRNRPFIKVLGVIISYGLLTGPMNYFSLFLDRHLSVSNVMVSVGTSIQLISEATFFFLSDKITAFMSGSTDGLVIGSHVALLLRLAVYSWLPDWNQWWIILVWSFEATQGFAYVCIQTAIIKTIVESVPSDIRTSAVGLAFTVRTLAAGIASGIGGAIADNIGLQPFFRYTFYCCVVITITFFWLFIVSQNKRIRSF